MIQICGEDGEGGDVGVGVGVCECKGSEQITAGWRQTKLFLLVKDILRFWHLGALIQPGYLL